MLRNQRDFGAEAHEPIHPGHPSQQANYTFFLVPGTTVPDIYQPDAMIFAGRSSVLIVKLLSAVGKLPDSSVENPPSTDPPLGLSAPAVCCIDTADVSSPCDAETARPVEAAAVFRVESTLCVVQESGASKGTIALAAALAAALASALAAAIARLLSAAFFSRSWFNSSSSWGALGVRFTVS